ncbi:NUDIX hydrolase [Paenibacillus sp. GSMTC-2017]|nr:NUDIX hydrolase [Paenibacillus sp. GSMTC-2017]
MAKETKHKLWREETIATESIYQGTFLSMQVDTVSLADGRTVSREIVKHPGAAAVIALLDGKLIVVDQFRKAIDKFQIEIPAGKLDANEDPIVAAGRELEEETGYRAKNLTLINSFYTSPGFSNQKTYLYFTDDVERGVQSLDDDEEIVVEAITIEQADAYIAEGRISDAKTIVAVYAWKQYLLSGKL